jgi:PAS domain S-box-containing protein
MLLSNLVGQIKSEAFWKERVIAVFVTFTYVLGNGIEYYNGKLTDDPPIIWMLGVVFGLVVFLLSFSQYKKFTAGFFKAYLFYINFNIIFAYAQSTKGSESIESFYLFASYVLFVVISQALDSRRELFAFTIAEVLLFVGAVYLYADYQPILNQLMNQLIFSFVLVGNLIINIQRFRLTQVSTDSRIQFKALSDNARDIQSIINSKFEFIYSNPALLETTGYSFNDIVGKPFLNTVIDQDKKQVESAFKSVLTQPDKRHSVEYRIKDTQGKSVWVETILSTFSTNTNNREQLIFAETRNIELRKELEEEIKVQLDAEALLIKHTNNFINLQRTEIAAGIDIALQDFGNMLYADGILVYRLQGKLVDEFSCINKWAIDGGKNIISYFNASIRINQPLVRFLRSFSSQRMSRGQVVDPSTLADLQILNTQNIAGKRFFAVPLQSGQVTNGFILFVFDENVPHSESGFLGLVGNMVSNAYTRQRTEQRLHEAQLTNEYILRALPDWLYILNKEGVFTGTNNQSTLQPYLQDHGLEGKRVDEVLPVEIGNLFLQTLSEVVHTGSAMSFEYLDTAIRDGKYFKAIIAPFKDNEYLLIIRDISDLKIAQNELETKAAKLEISNKELEEFAYVVSHDMKQPIRTIISYLSLLRRKYSAALNDEANEFITYSIDGANKMSDLIRDILQYSRLEQQISFVGEVDLNKTLNRVLAAIKDTITTNNAIVEIETLPSVKGNETMLNELFQNLVENGIKYNLNDNKKVNVNVFDKNEFWQFEISDNGIGFDQEYAQQIFKIFKRLHSDAEFSGTGIGLTICQKVVEKHGGKIWATSVKGKGSKFCFALPKG